MKAPCQFCGAMNDVFGMLNASNYRESVRVISEMPCGVHSLAIKYLAFFQTESGRAIPVEKSLRLMNELKILAVEAFIQYDNKPARKNFVSAWVKGLETILERPPRRLPLENHNYLRKIVWDILNDEDKKEERKRNEAERKHEIRKDDGKEEQLMTFAEFKALKDSPPSPLSMNREGERG